MVKLQHVVINKYKSIESEQAFDVDPAVTTLVGKNESGKTAVLEVIGKSNYFSDDPKFRFNASRDYPRSQKKEFGRGLEDVSVIACTYGLDDEIIGRIQSEVGMDAFASKSVTVSLGYRSGSKVVQGIDVDVPNFIQYVLGSTNGLSKEQLDTLLGVRSQADIDDVIRSTDSEQMKLVLQGLRPYFLNSGKWDNPVCEHVYRTHIEPRLPKFLYYSDYYELPSEVNVRQLQSGRIDTDEMKTAKALFELADIDVEQLLHDEDYEPYKAELEATAALITKELFKYWKTNSNLRVQFDIEKRITQTNPAQFDPILHIRVWSDRYQMSLPLASRSRGFNWFFSFIVWFSKIQEDRSSGYVLLLDEPGLSLHATAQDDLLLFLEDLSSRYQIIYTTHSPFMVSSDKLARVRTVVETTSGTVLSDSIQERDPDTLFPLQAALGFDIAHNLFIGKNNLLVEGVSDLVYLTIMSSLLEGVGRVGLRNDVTVIPVGGLDKVATFISLLRGQKLNIACLLDTFTDPKGKARLQNLFGDSIMLESHVRFFSEFTSVPGGVADIEDMFEKAEYLNLFNEAFPNYPNVELDDLPAKVPLIVKQLSAAVGDPAFNHYSPANVLAKRGASAGDFSSATLDRFENAFKAINDLY